MDCATLCSSMHKVGFILASNYIVLKSPQVGVRNNSTNHFHLCLIALCQKTKHNISVRFGAPPRFLGFMRVRSVRGGPLVQSSGTVYESNSEQPLDFRALSIVDPWLTVHKGGVRSPILGDGPRMQSGTNPCSTCGWSTCGRSTRDGPRGTVHKFYPLIQHISKKLLIYIHISIYDPYMGGHL